MPLLLGGVNLSFAPQITDRGREATCCADILRSFGVEPGEAPFSIERVAQDIWEGMWHVLETTSPAKFRSDIVEEFSRHMNYDLLLRRRSSSGASATDSAFLETPVKAVRLTEWGCLVVRPVRVQEDGQYAFVGDEETLVADYLW